MFTKIFKLAHRRLDFFDEAQKPQHYVWPSSHKCIFDLQLIYWWFWLRQSQTPGYKDTGVSRRAGQQTFCISSSPKLWLNQYVRLERGRWFPEDRNNKDTQFMSVKNIQYSRIYIMNWCNNIDNRDIKLQAVGISAKWIILFFLFL